MRRALPLVLALACGCGSFELHGDWQPDAPGPVENPNPDPDPTATATSAPVTLAINEVLFDIPTSDIAGLADSNRDGETNAEDEFIEIVNTGAEPVSLDDIELWEGQEPTPRHVFDDEDVLEPGQALVLHPTGSVTSDQRNCNAWVIGTSLLHLDDGEDEVRLVKAGQVIDRFEWSGGISLPLPGDGVSITRTPDRTGPFDSHPSVDDLGGVTRRWSPGCRVDYLPF